MCVGGRFRGGKFQETKLMWKEQAAGNAEEKKGGGRVQ